MPRGRRSSADNVVTMPHVRPEPPEELGEAEARHWRELVNTMPADWLSGAAGPLLVRLCKVIMSCELMETKIREMWQTNAPIDTKLLSAHAQASILLMKLSRELRLNPRSRYSPRSASEQMREAKLGSRPWEIRASGPWDD